MSPLDTSKVLEIMQECFVETDSTFIDHIVENKYGIDYFYKVIDMAKFVVKLMELEDAKLP